MLYPGSMNASLLAIALVAAVPTLAHADGVFASAAHEASASHEPSAYLQLGSSLGADDAGMWLAGTLDGGLRLGDTPLWAHGQLGYGSASEGFFQSGHGTFESARGGLEARVIIPHTLGIVGVYAGFDVGYRSLGFGDKMSSSAGDTVAVARGGLDLGTTHLRFRPGIEMLPVENGPLALTAALAYQW